MLRNYHTKYFPEAPRNIALVDQYSWPVHDTNKYMAYNGISHAIYSCNGSINYTLPLEMYPPVDDVHPQIKMVRRMHLNQRGPNPVRYIPPTVRDYNDGNVPARTGWSPHMSEMDSGMVDHYGNHRSFDEMDTEQNRIEGFYTRGHYETSPAVDTKYQSGGLAPYFQMGGRDGTRMNGQMGSLNQEAPGIHMRPGQRGPSSSGFIQSTMVTEPGKLPDPNGYATGCSACSGCSGR